MEVDPEPAAGAAAPGEAQAEDGGRVLAGSARRSRAKEAALQQQVEAWQYTAWCYATAWRGAHKAMRQQQQQPRRRGCRQEDVGRGDALPVGVGEGGGNLGGGRELGGVGELGEWWERPW